MAGSGSEADAGNGGRLVSLGARGGTGPGAEVISVDAMGGDLGPAAVVGGLAKLARRNAGARFLLHGPEAELSRLLRRRGWLAERVEIRDAPETVPMDAKPSRVLRRARGTSMLSALEAVARGEAATAVSCGNTGALLLLSMTTLKRAPGVERPAIAVLWPSRGPAGRNIVLDVGADIRADADNLLQYALMGAEYARLGLGCARPRVGLLNVGSEETKGGEALRRAAELIAAAAIRPGADFAYIGFVEGGDILSDRVDVIVTDGFTGNVALKTAEGTAKLISDAVKDAFAGGLGGRLAGLLALRSLSRLRKRIDPRRVNGGVFLGLDGAVVKSHGGADATGVAAALELAASMGVSGFPERVAEQVANALSPGEGPGVDSKLSGTSDG